MARQEKRLRDVSKYLAEAIDTFIVDPPSSSYQDGYLAALSEVYRRLIKHSSIEKRLRASVLVMLRRDLICDLSCRRGCETVCVLTKKGEGHEHPRRDDCGHSDDNSPPVR